MQRVHACHAALAAVFLVSACGGGGGSSSAPVDPTAPTFNSLVAESQAFYGAYAKGGKLSDNLTTQMPIAGNFTYQGTALLWTGDKIKATLDKPDTESLVAAGRLDMAANIAANTVTGTVTDFRSAPGQPMVTGTVAISGTIADNGYVGTPTGTLNIGVGRGHVTDGAVIGHFIGDYAKGTAGLVSGNLNDGADTFMMTYTGKR
ncbi:MAG: transferrin-binding protein-like solute binding protein [Paracoccus sp. (in: a-proteobacteria)]|nr:transferrin-binding protein-like solute binding protein [Paracoccus sp. (in: a-proteobacteria)]